jgi:hypothetical protein
MVVFSPWALGGWPSWSIWTMTAAGCLLGGLWLAKLGIRRRTGFRPPRWGSPLPGVLRYALGGVTLALLLWSLLSAVNPRSVVDPESLTLVLKPDFVPWLPHSYDQPATWFAFWQYVGLAGAFWALGDWLSIASRHERRRYQLDPRATGGYDAALDHRLPERVRRLAWVLSLNGGALALVGILSTISNPERLLWLVPVEGRYGDFFGPFYYRNHGALFVNLIWPLCLGLWLTRSLRAAQRGAFRASLLRPAGILLTACLGLMIAAPFVSSSRGGSIVAGLLLGLCLPVLALSLGSHRRILLTAGLTLLVGGGAGLWLAREVLTQKFFRDFVAYPTRLTPPLDHFTIRCVFRVPAPWGSQSACFAGLSDSPSVLWNSPGSMTLSLRRPGVFEARFVGANSAQILTFSAKHPLLAETGRTVELVFTHQPGSSAAYLNGESLELTVARPKAALEGATPLASQYLWIGRGAGGSMKFNERIDAVTFFDEVLPTTLIRRLARHEPASGPLLGLNLTRDRWTEVQPAPKLHIRPYTLSPGQWLATGLGGRARLDDLARQLMQQYPAAFGSGPGTFPTLFQVFSQDNDPATDWHVHNDHLETRITFGLVGAGFIYLGLLLCPVAALCRAGIPVPWYWLVLAGMSLVGALFHARFDWAFQNHALLFLGMLLCSTIAASSARPRPPRRHPRFRDSHSTLP